MILLPTPNLGNTYYKPNHAPVTKPRYHPVSAGGMGGTGLMVADYSNFIVYQ